jgi:hypothetical protein
MQPNPETKPYVRLVLIADPQAQFAASDVGLFLYDFDSLYELARLGLDPSYEEFSFSRFALYRGHRRLKPQDKMQVQALTLGSPLEIATAITVYAGAIGAITGVIWVLVQAVETIYNFRLNRQKLELEVQKLRQELAAHGEVPVLPADEEVPSTSQVREALEEREAWEYLEKVKNRLARSPIVLDAFELEVVIPE